MDDPTLSSPAEPRSPDVAAPTLYPVWRFVGLFLGLFGFIPLILLLVLLTSSDGKDAGILRVMILSQILSIAGGITMIRKPAWGFLTFGAGLFAIAAAVLVSAGWSLEMLSGLGFFTTTGMIYTFLGMKQLAADRSDSRFILQSRTESSSPIDSSA